METVREERQTAPGAFVAFARFVLCGGGLGIVSSLAVAGLAARVPWMLANAVITVVSTLLATELHARFTFGAGGRATWRQHVQSAGSAAAAYAVTSLAMLGLRAGVAEPGAMLEQTVYLSASALAGVGRFVVLRLLVFARSRADGATVRPAPSARPVPAGVTRTPVTGPALCRAA
ncbi:hypothetical protein ACIQNG_15550 [Streptomyces sp. NPDC091377]|uniref:hypothetical protein n=1 Tax=Streptomyces sp. NPDC091377 TaxID=3365995 RepID=UPI0038122492